MVRLRRPHLRAHLAVLTSSVRFVLGFIVVLFFQCIAALFDPIHRRGEPVRWGFVSYTVVIFSFVTVQTAVNLDIISNSFIDNREFSDSEGVLPPGPIGYEFFISPEAISIVTIIIFTLNNWLADGLLVSSLLDAAPTHPNV